MDTLLEHAEVWYLYHQVAFDARSFCLPNQEALGSLSGNGEISGFVTRRENGMKNKKYIDAVTQCDSRHKGCIKQNPLLIIYIIPNKLPFPNQIYKRGSKHLYLEVHFIPEVQNIYV